MPIEDHPLFPKWKEALEDVILTMELLARASNEGERQAAWEAHGHALARCAQIAGEILHADRPDA